MNVDAAFCRMVASQGNTRRRADGTNEAHVAVVEGARQSHAWCSRNETSVQQHVLRHSVHVDVCRVCLLERERNRVLQAGLRVRGGAAL